MKIRVRSQCSASRFPRAIPTHSLIPLEFSSSEDAPDPREIGLLTTNMLCKHERIALASLARTTEQNHGLFTNNRHFSGARTSWDLQRRPKWRLYWVHHMGKPEASHYGHASRTRRDYESCRGEMILGKYRAH